jgi:inner membrane protein
MDPVTHTLAGAALAETPLAKRIRLAYPAMLIGANLPDVDAVTLLVDTDLALGFRRGWTHGILAMAVLPLLLTVALLALDARTRRRRERRGLPLPPSVHPTRLLPLCYLAVLSHPFLDWLNTYGIRLLMPFSERWYYGDAVFIIDPWLWLTLGGAVLLARSGSGLGWLALAVLTTAVMLGTGLPPLPTKILWLVSLGAIVSGRVFFGSRLRAPRTATVGVALAALYIAAMLASTAFARDWVRDELDRRRITGVERLMVGPMPANPFRRDVLAEIPGGYRHGSLALFPGPRLSMRPQPLTKPQRPVAEAILGATSIRGAVSWMRFPFAEILETPDGYTIYLLDARYVRRRTDGFGSAVLHVGHGELRLPADRDADP